jgi:transcription elongation factor GreA
MTAHIYAIEPAMQAESHARPSARQPCAFSLIFSAVFSRVRIARGRPGQGPAAFRFTASERAPEMAGDHIPMTKAGADAIKREIKRLKSVERPKIVHEISVARDHGDLSENAEYHAAKEKQSHIEGRIQILEDRLARAEIIDVSRLSGERVVFGATVKLSDTDSGAEAKYTIVGEHEADLKKGRISITSPIARGLVGREVGDEVKIRTPGGEREYEILEVLFLEYVAEEAE